MKVVEIKGINKKFGKKEVLKNVSFDINENEIVGFIGPNGAGKSTLMKCLCSLIFPDSGEIIIDGYSLLKQREKALASVSAMIENPGIFPSLTGYENIVYFASMRNLSKQRIDEVIEFTKLGEAIHKKAGHYSLGMKQRLGLGIALLSKPKFLILDEPTNGLDPTGIIELRSEMRSLVEKDHISILISSHQLGEIEKVADRIICIKDGEIVKLENDLSDYNAYTIHFPPDAIEKAKKISIDGVVLDWQHNSVKAYFKDLHSVNDYMKKLIDQDIQIEQFVKEAVDIESVYKQIFGEKR